MIESIANNKKLFGYEKIFEDLINNYIKNTFPTKLLLSGPKGIGKSTFAQYFINFILYNNSIINKKNIDYNTFLNCSNILNKYLNQNFLYINLLEDKKAIEIDQIRSLIKSSQKKSLNSNKRFILIDNVEKLNKHSSNALLKILEEPYDDMFFLLILDSQSKILETIKSRCLIFNINFYYEKTLDIASKALNLSINDYISRNMLNNYMSVGDIIYLYNFSNNNNIDLKNISLKDYVNFIVNDKLYKKDPGILFFLVRLIEFFFYQNFLYTKNIKYYNLYKYFSLKFFNAYKYNLDFEILFLEIKKKVFNE